MASAISPEIVSLEDYRNSSYKPDRDFVRGELQERNVGEIEHSEMQLAILLWFVRHGVEWKIRPLPEMRVQVSDDNYRVADVAVVSTTAPREPALVTPPLIVIEMLSPEDRVQRCGERLDDLLSMGIPHVWVVDPKLRTGFDCSRGNWIRTERLEAGSSGIYLSIPELGLSK
jgi:Uma2 family endonuclease